MLMPMVGVSVPVGAVTVLLGNGLGPAARRH